MGISGELRAALDQSARIIVFTDDRGTILYVNDAFVKRYGYTEEEILGQNSRFFNTGYHDDQFYSEMWNTIKNGENWEGIFRNRTKTGKYIWERATINPVKNDFGIITGFLAIKEDVTNQRAISDQIEKDHYFLEELFSNSPVGIAIVEPIYVDEDKLEDLLIIKANPSAGRITDKLGLVGLTIKEFMPEEAITPERLSIMLNRKFSFETHLKEIGKYLRFRSFPFGKDNICIFFYDVSHYMSSIKALEDSEERYFKVVEDSPALISRYDENGILRYVNYQYCSFFEEQHSDLVGTSFLNQIPEEERNEVWGSIQNLTPENPYSEVELRVVLKDGSIRWLHRLDRALIDSNGKIFEFQSVAMDITAVKQTEDNLKKLNNTKDKLFSIIAHDVKNPFNAILGFATLLRKNIDQYSKDQIKEYVERILSSSENLYKLLDDLLIWAKSQLGHMTVSKQKMQLSSLVLEAFDSFVIQANEKGVELINEVDSDIYIEADMEMMRFVIRNLVHNGIKFTDSEGKVICSCFSNGSYEILSIKDTGIGIKPQKLANLFDIGEFMATAGTAQEKGTGIGLNLSRELVEKNGGKIKVESEIGVGTEFKVYLPK
ncbi:PAS domain-containing sensor histidine kinase [Carboxylicivirga caseinilyticus]|uniref:PAS domain-containing sensor histidine kinase n=1 Tax=Carboxylicivirga caseinilyticus TaxID=3417572 RepID=UPI003D3535EC|nr:PAS domain S-box protein [Marinilabiliaceae bacterium A049]